MPVVANGLTCCACEQEVRECKGILFPHWDREHIRACKNSLRPAREPFAYVKEWFAWPDGVSPFLVVQR